MLHLCYAREDSSSRSIACLSSTLRHKGFFTHQQLRRDFTRIALVLLGFCIGSCFGFRDTFVANRLPICVAADNLGRLLLELQASPKSDLKRMIL
jgi:hypothetical protein